MVLVIYVNSNIQISFLITESVDTKLYTFEKKMNTLDPPLCTVQKVSFMIRVLPHEI